MKKSAPKKTTSKVATAPAMATSTDITVKPTAIKVAKGFAIFQLTVGVLALIFIYWVFFGNPDGAFFDGVRDGFSEGVGKDAYYLSDAEGAGYIFGLFFLGLLAPFLAVLSIQKRSRNLSIAALVIYVLTLLSSISLFSLVVIICMLLPESRKYLNWEKKKA